MSFIEVAILLFIVIDPFGNIPFILAILQNLDEKEFRRAIFRELGFAFAVLLLFLFVGQTILTYLGISESSLSIAGGVILFIISLRMIFRGHQEIFGDEYAEDPWFVPIAIPSIAGPSAIATLMLVRSQEAVAVTTALTALIGVMAITLMMLLASRRLADLLGRRGLSAMNRLMGMLLNLIAVNMMLRGVEQFVGTL